ncbi:MAG TPA: DUF4431 domain-containing protein [Verrucomicrobiaceae bacterium]|jgi:hypothetical protein
MRAYAICLAISFGTLAKADQVLQYEPAAVEISGKISKGRAQHPNESWFDFQVIKLDTPASIKGDDSGDSVNESEAHITEIQIYSTDPALRKKLGALNGKKATLKGTLFHSHTAWHVRQLVLSVTEVKEKIAFSK